MDEKLFENKKTIIKYIVVGVVLVLLVANVALFEIATEAVAALEVVFDTMIESILLTVKLAGVMPVRDVVP